MLYSGIHEGVQNVYCNDILMIDSRISINTLAGLLAAVGSPSVDLVGPDISLTWTAPFTLDISNVDHDITYCVDVVNSTSSSIVLSECGINVTGFNFSIPIGRVCDNYTFTVTPVNGAGNGTAVTLGYSQDFSRMSKWFNLLVMLLHYR